MYGHRGNIFLPRIGMVIDSVVLCKFIKDRKLWKNLFQGEADFQSVMEKISNVASEEVDKNGQIVMTKVVGGFIGIK